MVKKVTFVILLLLTIQFSQSDFIFADSLNVTDCFESEVDCADLEDNENEVNKDNNELLNDEGKSKPSFFVTFIQTIFALLLVLLLIYFLLKFLNKRNKIYQQVNALESIGGISVGANKSIQMIRIGEKVYLIGVGNNVEMLQEITDEVLLEELLTKEKMASPVESVFQMILNRKKKSGVDTEEGKTTKMDFTKIFNKELKDLQKNREEILNKHRDKGDQDG